MWKTKDITIQYLKKHTANTRKTKTYYLYNRKKLKFKIYFQNLFSCCITFHYLISL